MDTNEYRISFFKPTTTHARINRNLTVVLVIIWIIAVFGFQGLLKVIEKPTPEPILKEFNAVWGDVEHKTDDKEKLKNFGVIVMNVMSKPYIKPDDKAILKDVFGKVVFQLIPEEGQNDFAAKIASFQALEKEITSLSDQTYTKLKNEITETVSSTLSLDSKQIAGRYVPFLFDEQPVKSDETSMSALPGIMNLYLTHNRSFLTDAKFLGFPFHYFYTAVLLLIIFVFLCWLYCKLTDKTHLKHEVIEQHDN